MSVKLLAGDCKPPQTIFVQFKEVAEGFIVSASSDSGIRRMKPRCYSNYDQGCRSIAARLEGRQKPPLVLQCDLVS